MPFCASCRNESQALRLCMIASIVPLAAKDRGAKHEKYCHLHFCTYGIQVSEDRDTDFNKAIASLMFTVMVPP